MAILTSIQLGWKDLLFNAQGTEKSEIKLMPIVNFKDFLLVADNEA
jgi:hypothetical protein